MIATTIRDTTTTIQVSHPHSHHYYNHHYYYPLNRPHLSSTLYMTYIPAA